MPGEEDVPERAPHKRQKRARTGLELVSWGWLQRGEPGRDRNNAPYLEAGGLEGRWRAEGARPNAREGLSTRRGGHKPVESIVLVGPTSASQGPEGLTRSGTLVETGTQPASETPEEAAWAQHLIGLTGASSLALLAGVIATSTAIESSIVNPRGLLSHLLT